MSHYKRDYVEEIRTRGYRVTPQRLIILDAICEIGGHATFGDIYRRVKAVSASIDQSTIYRNLEFLCEIGLITSAEIGNDGKVYEIAGETPHHHLVCKACGSVQELSHAVMTALLEQIRTQYGFEVETEHLVLPGLCQHCLHQTK